jgi:hypothetical protein
MEVLALARLYRRLRSLDLDLPRLCRLGLRKRQAQDAVLELGVGLVGADLTGECELPDDRAEPALAPVPVLRLLFLLFLGLALDGQDVAVDGDVDVLRLEAGERRLTTTSSPVSNTSTGKYDCVPLPSPKSERNGRSSKSRSKALRNDAISANGSHRVMSAMLFLLIVRYGLVLGSLA